MLIQDIINLPATIVIVRRLSEAISTLPTTQNWLYAAGLLLLFTIIALPIGFVSGFLKIEGVKASGKIIISIIATSFLMPAVTEELFFRVLLFPGNTENASVLMLELWGCISLVLFIAYHPLNAISFFSRGLQTFFNLSFLGLAALLGIICTLAYLQSGSLWTPVAIHWLVVVVWLLLLGGYSKLYS